MVLVNWESLNNFPVSSDKRKFPPGPILDISENPTASSSRENPEANLLDW